MLLVTLMLNRKNQLRKKNYELPDGQVLSVGDEMYRCPELLFHPEGRTQYDIGISDLIYKSVQKCKMPKELFSNIILCGGSTTMPGFAARITKDLKQLAPSMKINVPDQKGMNKYSCWLGAAKLAGSKAFDSQWISKEDYDENGPAVIHKKCPYYF